LAKNKNKKIIIRIFGKSQHRWKSGIPLKVTVEGDGKPHLDHFVVVLLFLISYH
jgi:hypothetical protein